MGGFKLGRASVINSNPTAASIDKNEVVVTSDGTLDLGLGVAPLILASAVSDRHVLWDAVAESTVPYRSERMMIRCKGHAHTSSLYLSLYVAGNTINGTARFGETFDLANGVRAGGGSNGNGVFIDADMFDLGSGWFECYVVGGITSDVSSSVIDMQPCFGITNNFASPSIATAFTGTGSSGLYAYDLEFFGVVPLTPDFDAADQSRKIETVHRTRSGAQFRYKWGAYTKYKASVEDISSADAYVVNSWWSTNEPVRLFNTRNVVVCSGYISSESKPIGQFMKPYDDQFKGVIELEGY